MSSHKGAECMGDSIGREVESSELEPHPSPVLTLHIPEPKRRPGDLPDFSGLLLSDAGSVDRPPITATAIELRDYARLLIRVLADDGNAVGAWNPKLDAETLRRGLRAMVVTRVYDERMQLVQRQGRTSFYLKCTGEEAVA